MALVMTVWLFPVGFEETLEVCAPEKAKKRKENVPTNSPMTATKCPRKLLGIIRSDLCTAFG